MTNEKEQNWYFTFGYGQLQGPNSFIKFYGTHSTAREQMVSAFGQKWSMQYSEEQFAGQQEEYNLTEIQ